MLFLDLCVHVDVCGCVYCYRHLADSGRKDDVVVRSLAGGLGSHAAEGVLHARGVGGRDARPRRDDGEEEEEDTPAKRAVDDDEEEEEDSPGQESY